MEIKIERKSNIELLRLLAMVGVIVVHYNGMTGIAQNSLWSTDAPRFNALFLIILETVCICSVNVFVVISGFFQCKSNNRVLGKPLNLLLQLVLYREVFSTYTYLRVGGAKPLLLNLIPNNYFVILFIVLYLISPYINIAINSLSQKSLRQLVLIVFFLFSVWTFGADLISVVLDEPFYGLSCVGLYGSQYGYTIVNFVVLYILGGYIRISELSFSTKYCIITFFSCTALIFCGVMLEGRGGYDYTNSVMLSYSNPLVIFQALSLFMLFRNMNIRNKYINKLAAACFTCYLIQAHCFGHLFIDKAVQMETWKLALHIAASIVLIYLFSYVVYCIYNYCTKSLFSRLDKIYIISIS